jgi:hypothetical protein
MIDLRLHRIVATQPFPLLFAAIITVNALWRGRDLWQTSIS